MIENENCSRSADKKFYEQVAWVSSFRWFLKCAGLSWSVDLAEKAWCLATLNFYNSATHSSVQAKCLLHPCGKHTCDWKTAVFRLEKHLDNAGSSLLYSFAWVKQVVEVAGFPQKKNPFLSVVRDRLDKRHRQPEETKHFPQTSPKKHKIPNGRGRSGCFTGPWPVKMAWRIWLVTVYP